MKKYYPVDFDEKGNAVLGNAKSSPTSNGFIPTAWAPGGGDDDEPSVDGDGYPVVFTLEQQNITSDKTPAEIKEAKDSGKLVYAISSSNDGGNSLNAWLMYADGNTAKFYSTVGLQYFSTYTVNSDKSVSVVTKSL